MLLLNKQDEKIKLTHTELMILYDVMCGLSNKTIAEKNHLSVHTVKFHIQNLLEKTYTHSRTELCTKILLMLLGQPLTVEFMCDKLSQN